MGDLKASATMRLGMMLLAGGDLLRQREEVNQAFREELRFLRSCFLESPEKARELTSLRLAQEVEAATLQKGELLRRVEPSMVYRRVGAGVGSRAASAASRAAPAEPRGVAGGVLGARLRAGPVGPRAEALRGARGRAAVAGNAGGGRKGGRSAQLVQQRPALVEVNAFLELYCGAGFLHRAQAVFDSIPVGLASTAQ